MCIRDSSNIVGSFSKQFCLRNKTYQPLVILENPIEKAKANMQRELEEKQFKLEGRNIVAQFGDKTVTYTIDEKIPGIYQGAGGFYVIMFTCGICDHKHVKSFTKKAYHSGIVLIRCEGCDNMHLIADNLGWFRDEPVNVEDLLKEKGENCARITHSPAIQKLVTETLHQNIVKFHISKGQMLLDSSNKNKK
eukprot:TRINITY_DN3184_c0_g1_i1.p1 TRINITY_DN3184_c0_g1~~TRINITY_DN3184_c0_g1_i1.p1  ORF type:complete len:192 (-),score=13.55 TRINITY_DN3184_c0_g1_i1:92-667(-)